MQHPMRRILRMQCPEEDVLKVFRKLQGEVEDELNLLNNNSRRQQDVQHLPLHLTLRSNVPFVMLQREDVEKRKILVLLLEK